MRGEQVQEVVEVLGQASACLGRIREVVRAQAHRGLAAAALQVGEKIFERVHQGGRRLRDGGLVATEVLCGGAGVVVKFVQQVLVGRVHGGAGGIELI